MLKIKLIIGLLLCCNVFTWAQTAATITVGGTTDKYYPVTFSDPEWVTGKPTEIFIGRPSIHQDVLLMGSTLASFKYHTNRWGNGSNFINATIEKSAQGNFFAGWDDATTSNANAEIIIWLKGGSITYLVKSSSTVVVTVYDGVQNALPFMESNGPSRTYKTAIDSYVITGSMSSSSSLVAGNGTFLSNVGVGMLASTERLFVDGNIGIKGNSSNRYIIIDEQAAGTTKLTLQAGAGSRGFGGGLNLYGHSNAARPGSVVVGISVGAGTAGSSNEGRFAINDEALGEGADIFTVLRSGKAGIGITNPQTKLHVYQSVQDQTGLIIQGNTINSDAAQHYVAMTLDGDYGNGTGNYSQIRSYSNLYHTWGSRLAFFTTSNATANTLEERMRIDANGNIGIGTSTPAYNLDVAKFVRIGAQGGSDVALLGGGSGIGAQMKLFYNNGAENVRLTGNNDSWLNATIGNVGIGTTTPAEKLSVNGKIRAKEIKIEPNPATWPDYVFEEDHKIGTLEELEHYIKANKHLPEMPTAKEVAANGVELGELNKLLLKKVEELTLLLIEQAKEVKQLKLDMKVLKEK